MVLRPGRRQLHQLGLFYWPRRPHLLGQGPLRGAERGLYHFVGWACGLRLYHLLGLGAANGLHHLFKGVPDFRSHHVLRTKPAVGRRNLGLLPQK